jgi:hypothetical protein
MIQYSLLGRTAESIRLNTFRGLAPSPSTGKTDWGLRMGTDLVPETLHSNELTRLCAREDYEYIEYVWVVYVCTLQPSLSSRY